LRVKIEGGGEKCVCLTYLTLFKMKSQNLWYKHNQNETKKQTKRNKTQQTCDHEEHALDKV